MWQQGRDEAQCWAACADSVIQDVICSKENKRKSKEKESGRYTSLCVTQFWVGWSDNEAVNNKAQTTAYCQRRHFWRRYWCWKGDKIQETARHRRYWHSLQTQLVSLSGLWLQTWRSLDESQCLSLMFNVCLNKQDLFYVEVKTGVCTCLVCVYSCQRVRTCLYDMPV